LIFAEIPGPRTLFGAGLIAGAAAKARIRQKWLTTPMNPKRIIRPASASPGATEAKGSNPPQN
jgi:hypothetical protein